MHITWVNEKIFMANDREFKMIEIKKLEPLQNGEIRYVDIEKLEIKIWSVTIPSPLKMHGFFANSYSESQDYAMCNIELEDNQIST